MFCKNCGKELSDKAFECPGCKTKTAVAFNPPPNYLIQSILVTLCCCWICGIPAIVYAAQVNSKYALGDIEGALKASKSANMWSWIAFGIGLALILFYFFAGFILPLLGFGAMATAAAAGSH